MSHFIENKVIMVVEKFRGLNMFQVQKELAGHEAVIVALFEEENE